MEPLSRGDIMSKISKSSSSSGIGFTGLLTILFIGLKLTGNINWSWWWVLSPIWIPVLVLVLVLTALLTFSCLAMLWEEWTEKSE